MASKKILFPVTFQSSKAGRTGRDGNNAENIVLFSEEEKAIPMRNH